MDDISQKLSAILNDPEGMEKIKAMAENLLGNSGTSKQEEPLDDLGIDMVTLTKMVNMMKNRKDESDRVKLLLALRPHLSEEKQQKVDTAVKILKLLDIAPLFKEMGILNL